MTTRRRLSVLLLGALVCACTAWVPVARADTSSKWDSRIEPIATEVAKLRGLQFEHAVPVDFLSEQDFQKKVSVKSKLSKRDKEDLARSESQFRAIGLIAGDVDLLSAVDTFQTSGTLAFYDPKKKRVTVRGTEIDVAMRSTLAHELTHALQDQHFDLVALERQAERDHSSSALRAVIEGDAVRVQRLYEAGWTDAERAEYKKIQAAKSKAAYDEIRAKGVPDSITTFFQVPYVLGPPMLALVIAEKDDAGLDALFEHPPTNDASFMNPASLVDGTKTLKVATPKLAPGEKAVDKPDTFGSLALYLMLAGRGDPGIALDVTDGWAGDSMITFRRDETTCVRAAFVGRSDAATTTIADAIAGWAAAMPGGAATSKRDTNGVTLTACDPGTTAIAPPNSATAALVVADLRSELLAQVVGSGLPLEAASCITTRLVRDPVLAPLVAQAAADPNAALSADDTKALQSRLIQLTTACARR